MSDEPANGSPRLSRPDGNPSVMAPWARALREATEGGRTGANGAPLAGLKRFMEREQAPKPRPGERCEMCGEPIAEEHSHVVNIQTRALMCTCRGCYLLFTHDGAAQGRYRAVPDRYLYDPAFTLGDAQWDELQIPVSMAFFFVNSSLDRFVAFYPSPAGATESLLPLDTWGEIIAANPAFAAITPDVEALLLHRPVNGANGADILPAPDGAGGSAVECYLAPISACYELVGRVRLHWRGFSGGEEVWREIGAFFAGLREQSRVVGSRA